MSDPGTKKWSDSKNYERYIGRWSRRVALEFLDWLEPSARQRWLEIGVGTGAASEAVLQRADPVSVIALDRSAAYLAVARGRLRDPRVRCEEGDALALPFEPGSFDLVFSALVLNHLAEPARALAQMTRVCISRGTVAGYVWDYAEGLQLMRYLWDAAVELDPAHATTDPGRRYPICRPAALRALLEAQGLHQVMTTALVIDTVFEDFDDYWDPLAAAQGSTAMLFNALSAPERERLREALLARLPVASDGSIALSARAWAFRGTR